ncbi:hypothetical protein EPUS_08247 [Endocarpon pusillum Z07020]|uniref:DUF1330 domain-containing protein n=1 Tax=Endocarpon pusillum (strain Z07020 / HMAS-L-300199) TaxID=1263415 RepID=U1GU66_ENDPU|nr:uncharacterized protein EPUS_08247 [Endocarpon pusillum Z07020]ERF75993.1 hypothetical protein EPUS_08247 [Endocarpon pusillum Z07020]
MSRCTFYLLSLHGSASDFKASISTISNTPLFVGQVHRWVAPPMRHSIDPLTTQGSWDVFLFFAGSVKLPEAIEAFRKAEWRLEADAPPPMLAVFKNTDQQHSRAGPEDVPALTGRWDHPYQPDPDAHQEFDYSPELQNWVRTFGKQEGKSAVWMFNLLAYQDGKRETFMKYVEAFAASVGKAVGSESQIFGQVIRCSSTSDGEEPWEDAALVHYPSVYHFGDLVGSEEYQKLDAKYKVGTIKDTCILCLTEL